MSHDHHNRNGSMPPPFRRPPPPRAAGPSMRWQQEEYGASFGRRASSSRLDVIEEGYHRGSSSYSRNLDDNYNDNYNDNRVPSIDSFGRFQQQSQHHDKFIPPPPQPPPFPTEHHRTHTRKRRSSSPPPPPSYHHQSPSSSSTSLVRTSAITIHETNHGHKRRCQRAIPTREIQEAIKYGTKRIHAHDPSLFVYAWKGKEHIVTRDSAALVTTMVKTIPLQYKVVTKDDSRLHRLAMERIHGDKSKGTTSATHNHNHIEEEESSRNKENKKVKFEQNTALFCQDEHEHEHEHEQETSKRGTVADDEDDHDGDYDDDYETTTNTDNNSQEWKSHSIIIVDKSGSMRGSDVNGSRTRLGAVWLSLAQDYIEHRINIGLAGSYDIVSIILMGETPQLLIDRYPTNKVLFNRVVDFFRQSEDADRLWKQLQHLQHNYNHNRHQRRCDELRNVQRKLDCLMVRAKGHGCYGPSLTLAEELLENNDNDSCALSLILLSDGRPSDSTVFKKSRDDTNNELLAATGRMASRFGRRFTFSTIGMGSNHEFDTLVRF